MFWKIVCKALQLEENNACFNLYSCTTLGIHMGKLHMLLLVGTHGFLR